MLNLTREEKKTLKKVFDDMQKCGLFCGRYDAKNGNVHFMYGIGTVMEHLAYLISDSLGNDFSQKFTENMIKSEKKVLTKR